MQGRSATKQSESGNHSNESETVVAMQMRDEHRPNLGEAYARSPQLNLRSLAAINHKELSTHIHHLRCGVVFQCRQRAATAQDVYFKRFQERYFGRVKVKMPCLFSR